MKRTKTAQSAIDRLYATMATAAAQRTIKKIEWDKAHEANFWADQTALWLEKSSAVAIRWHYSHPRV